MPASKTSRRPQNRPAAKGRSGRPGGRPNAPVARKATAADWIGGARLRTLPVAVAPVLLGSAAAAVAGGYRWKLALACLAVSVLLQIAVNYANDYSDGVRGTDKHRVGPSRLTGSGAAKPRTVLTVALVFFGLAAVAGLAIVIRTEQWWLLAVGAAAIVAGYFYTGGKRPYGYFGLGEVFVFVFFGLVATVGTTFVQLGTVNIESWLAGVAIGFLACAVLMVNNIRDIDQDRLAGKRTLAVLLGPTWARVLYTFFMLAPFGILVFFALFYARAPYVYLALLAAVPAIVITLTAKTSRELITALQVTSLTVLLFGAGLAAAIAF
ncbi:1,4-dihydroxy-2-naphthoate polyprenyltransferase [Desertivibrio insolitus]|uniref:1,4-dihydroxy-2-naphthoate polyprenyltransferase n=1 Tax=Herbiconiux sp. SYSU D00978 TaxID=2812562 RepID=UPI001A96307A|nr:1,4-dihydroxy-2-naphthoate polyprenyltransferase [Herbiconiux sp. SYSU D00978]